MSFYPGLSIGEKISHGDLVKIFQCGNMGGMLPSKKTNTLVIISDLTKGLYKDKWVGDTIHYVGTGQKGDQELCGNPGYKNGLIYNSESNNIQIHFFEVKKKTEYIYQGIVKLADLPYQDIQRDINNDFRNVWVFPLRKQNITSSTTKANMIVDEELLEEIVVTPKSEYPKDFVYESKPREKTKPTIINQVEIQKRNKRIALNALAYANYTCEIDNGHKTFKRKNIDLNYTEPHHLVPMEYSKEFVVSLDVEENIVSLCSNCHKLIHYGRSYNVLLRKLYDERKDLLKNVGIVITYERLEQMYG